MCAEGREARWTRKHGVAFYGYKLNASTDRHWGFIRRYDVSAANVHDSRHFEQVLDPTNTGRTVGRQRLRRCDVGLRQRGYARAIQHQGQGRKPLSER